MLYNHSLSTGLDYFIDNLKGSKNSLADKNAGGFLKQKATSEIEENENRFYLVMILGRLVTNGCLGFLETSTRRKKGRQ